MRIRTVTEYVRQDPLCPPFSKRPPWNYRTLYSKGYRNPYPALLALASGKSLSSFSFAKYTKIDSRSIVQGLFGAVPDFTSLSGQGNGSKHYMVTHPDERVKCAV